MFTLRQCCILVSLAVSTQAGSVVNYFGPGNSYDPSTGATVSGPNGHNVGTLVQTGIAFTPTENFSLQQIDVALSYLAGTNSVVLTINLDSGGAPGPVLLSWNLSNLPPVGTCCPIETVRPSASLLLSSGVRYWIVASPGAADTSVSWETNNLGEFGLVAQKMGNAPFNPVRAKVSAFDVQGILAPAPGSGPLISSVLSAAGEISTIAPNTWVEIKGTNLGPLGEGRAWQPADFVNNQMPTALEGIGVKMNGKNAYVYYTGFNQINVLTPPDLAPGAVQINVVAGGLSSTAFASEAQQESPSFFVNDGGPYVAAAHIDASRIGPPSPGSTTPAKPGEVILLYANGFGATSLPVVPGSASQMASLPTLPTVQIGGVSASVQFAGLVSPGLYQLNVVVPASAPNGDVDITATYHGFSTQLGTLLTIQR